MRCARNACGAWRPALLVRLTRSGVHFDGAWYCSSGCLEQSARRWLGEACQPRAGAPPAMPPLKLGLLLIHQGAITASVLRRALDEQARSGLRLGAQLQRMGLVSSHELLRALAAQANVSYLASVDAARLPAPSPLLSRAAARALGLIPIDTDVVKRRIAVACVAPVPRLALGALRELTSCVVEPLLVSDDLWSELAVAYGAQQPGEAPLAPVQNIGDVAAHIAQAAEDGRASRMAHARCDPYMWVRLEGDGPSEDLLLNLTDNAATRESAWPAAPTSH